MEWIGALFLILALAILIALFVGRPFINRFFARADAEGAGSQEMSPAEHRRSSLLADRDQVIGALQELEFDNTLGKVPEEDYPVQRAELMQHGAEILRQLDALKGVDSPAEGQSQSAEERISAAVAARRADAASLTASTEKAAMPANGNGVHADRLEDLIASRRRQRAEKSAGFCPKCGRPVTTSDRFCSRCGATL